MAQSQSPDDDSERERVPAHTVTEGDRVFMGINLHGTSQNMTDVEYDRDLRQAGVEGTVTEAPRDSARELMEDGTPVMADFTVETDDGETFTWNVDNGYVHGFHPGLGRRSDIGHFGGFYKR
jgi:hypothetical protein